MSDITERWLPVPGYEGYYEVSSLGNVRSLHVGTKRRKRGDLLAPAISAGHLMVVLYRDRDRKSRLVHQLVLEAFIGPREPGTESLHGTGGALDNRLANLRYGTPKENCADKLRDGTANRGERCGTAKVTEKIVIECRHRYVAGETQAALAREFGISQSAVSEMISGKKWGHVAEGAGASRERNLPTGESHWSARLTWDKVAEIRRRAAVGEVQRSLARDFGVSQPVISKIVRRETWWSARQQ